MSYIINTNNQVELNFDVDGTNYSQITTSYPIGCTNIPTDELYNNSFAEVQNLATWSPQLALQQATYSDQEGVIGAMILFAEAKRVEAASYALFWQTTHVNCIFNYNWFTFHCNNQETTCFTKETTLLTYRLQSGALELLWTELKEGLQLQLASIVENESIYNVNQTLQAQFTSLLASINVDIAQSNLEIQIVEDQLLDLKNKELQGKAMYIIAPLLLLLGIALIFND